MEQFIREVLKNSYDLHIHTAANDRGFLRDDVDVLRALDAYEMAGAVTKPNRSESCSRAYAVNKCCGTKAKMLGALALAFSTGGINPYAVKSALKLGAKIVWLPVLDYPKGLGIRGDDGNLLPQMYEIFDLMTASDAWLATGHLSAEDAYLVCTEAVKHHVRCILTHPESRIPLAMQKELGDMGIMLEKTWCNVWHGTVTVKQMAENIRTVGAEHCFLSSDFGQSKNPLPPDGLSDMIKALLQEGIREEDIYRMGHANPVSMMEKPSPYGRH